MSEEDRIVGVKISEYRVNAKSKNFSFELNRTAFATLIGQPCRYCGLSPAGGIDRLNSALGYTAQNVAPCCSDCNYAKRSLSETEFLALVQRIYQHRVAPNGA